MSFQRIILFPGYTAFNGVYSPEKFRELLGKENFTDLALGDAKSCELTVLFCDIRGFSIFTVMLYITGISP